MEAFTLVALAALVVKVVTVIKSVGKDNNMVLTQVVSWAVGVGAVALAAHSTVGHDLVVFGTAKLGDLKFADYVLAGMSLASTGSFAYDIKKSVDNNDSAAEPALLNK